MDRLASLVVAGDTMTLVAVALLVAGGMLALAAVSWQLGRWVRQRLPGRTAPSPELAGGARRSQRRQAAPPASDAHPYPPGLSPGPAFPGRCRLPRTAGDPAAPSQADGLPAQALAGFLSRLRRVSDRLEALQGQPQPSDLDTWNSPLKPDAAGVEYIFKASRQ